MIDRSGTVIGHVTSCVSLGEHQIGLGLVNKMDLPEGTAIGLINPPRGNSAPAPTELQVGDRMTPPITGGILSRFMARGTNPQVGEE